MTRQVLNLNTNHNLWIELISEECTISRVDILRDVDAEIPEKTALYSSLYNSNILIECYHSTKIFSANDLEKGLLISNEKELIELTSKYCKLLKINFCKEMIEQLEITKKLFFSLSKNDVKINNDCYLYGSRNISLLLREKYKIIQSRLEKIGTPAVVKVQIPFLIIPKTERNKLCLDIIENLKFYKNGSDCRLLITNTAIDKNLPNKYIIAIISGIEEIDNFIS